MKLFAVSVLIGFVNAVESKIAGTGNSYQNDSNFSYPPVILNVLNDPLNLEEPVNRLRPITTRQKEPGTKQARLLAEPALCLFAVLELDLERKLDHACSFTRLHDGLS